MKYLEDSTNKVICPICKGKGKIEQPRDYKENLKLAVKTAKSLIKAGFSYRQTMRIMDYKSPATIQYLCKKH